MSHQWQGVRWVRDMDQKRANVPLQAIDSAPSGTDGGQGQGHHRASHQASQRRLAKQRGFLKAFAALGSVQAACAQNGLPKRTIYNWVERDDVFARQFEDAKEAATDVLEGECRRRAVDGVAEPIYFQGGVVGHVQRYSDACLLALLNAYRPDRFKRRHGQAGREGDGSISNVVHVSYDASMKPDDME